LPVGRGWLPEVHVASLPQGKDPADFARAEGAEGVIRMIEAAVPIVEFLLRRTLEGADLASPDGRARSVRRGVDVLREVGDSLLRHEYALWLADRTGVEPYEITKALDSGPRPGAQRRAPTGPAPKAPMAVSGPHRIEREALRSLFAFPKLMNDDLVRPADDDFSLPIHRSLFRFAAFELLEHGKIDAGRVTDRVQDADLRNLASELLVGQAPEAQVARDTLARLKVLTIERHIVERKGRLRSLHPDRDGEAYDALFEELLELEKQKRELSAPR
jgi:DNA primase